MKRMQIAVVTAVCSAAVVMMSVSDSSAQGRGAKGRDSNEGKQGWYNNQEEGSASGCSKATAGKSSTTACSKGGGKGCGKYRKTGTCSHVEQKGQDNSQVQGKGRGKAQKQQESGCSSCDKNAGSAGQQDSGSGCGKKK